MLSVENLHKTYRIGTVSVHALRGVSLNIERGEFVAIMGASGSGKSTLMHLLGLLDKPDRGEIRFLGTDVTQFDEERFAHLRNRIIGFVFQQFNLLSRTTALDNVMLPQFYARDRGVLDTGRAEHFLKKVGLGDRIDHRPNELSGGQQQRVAIARALVNDPHIILADEPTGNLDSHARKDIMEFLTELHEQGQTIIMVTHDDEVAGYATRIVRMADGRVLSDERKKGTRVSAASGAPEVPFTPDEPRSLSLTEIREYLQQAFRMIISHKMRSFLSMLGVLIGVGCVIVTLALGRGAREAIVEELSRFGSNVLTIRPGSSRTRGVALEQGAVTRLMLEDAAAIQKNVDGVLRLAPQVVGQAQIAYGNKNWNTRIMGTTPGYLEMRNQETVAGRFFVAQENDERKRVAVIGKTIYRELFDGREAVGETIKINRTEFRVIGILPTQGPSTFRDQDDIIMIPLLTAMYRVLSKKYVDQVDVQMNGPERLEEAQEAIRALIIQRHRLPPARQDTFDIRDNTQVQQALSSTTKTFSILLGAVAAISLVVGGIGIMNIMLVSVTERTREIGLRKALGATARDIMLQFLTESIVITFLGGTAGMLLGVLISWLITVTAGWKMVVGIDSILLSFLFSVAVGILFGLWPAKTAARLDPIRALRYE